MKDLYIIGAGGFGREMFAAARDAIAAGADFRIAGFLDDRADALAGRAGYPPVVSSLAGYEPRPWDVFVTALGNVETRRRCAEAIAAKGGRFATIIHPSATVGPGVEIGEGSFVAAGARLTADVRLGRHVCVFHNSTIGHDARFGDCCHVYALCSIGGNVVAGDCVAVYPGSVVTPRRKLGSRCVVGALSAVFTDVPPGCRVLGNPAAPLE